MTIEARVNVRAPILSTSRPPGIWVIAWTATSTVVNKPTVASTIPYPLATRSATAPMLVKFAPYAIPAAELATTAGVLIGGAPPGRSPRSQVA